MAFIDARRVSVAYPIYSARGRSLKNQLFRTVGGGIKVNDDSRIYVSALDRISVSLRPGDRVALLGGNGAGKSTLLKVLAGILEPSEGELNVSGRLSSLLDMSMGMDPEATGYENIIMRSVFLGASFAEAKARVGEIEAFSELGDYIRLPLRTYSTGMSLRLSFAIAMSVLPDILVLDEMLTTGDASFAVRAKARMQAIVDELEILVIATHDLNTARDLCNRGLVLSHGRIVTDAPIEDALEAYEALDQAAVAAS